MVTPIKSNTTPAVGRVELIAGHGLDDAIVALVRQSELERALSEPGLYPTFMARLSRTLEDAFERHNQRSLLEVHKALYLLYEQNFAAPAQAQAANQFHPFLLRVRNDIERAWERFETRRAHAREDEAPDDAAAFSSFFKDRCRQHRLSRHPLFDFLEFKATRDEIVEFFLHDRPLIQRFCDLVTMAMVGADEEVRGELAVNLWDEMGNGDPAMRHTALFRRLLDYVGADRGGDTASTEAHVGILDWQGLAGYNLHLFFSLHRRNYFKSVGCLGSAELMDSNQYAKILHGCRRIGMADAEPLAYYVSHAEVDMQHGESWLANVLVPLVLKYPQARAEIILGAEMRLNITADYFDSILTKLISHPRGRSFQAQPVPRVARIAEGT
jgi:hypothetical protein